MEAFIFPELLNLAIFIRFFIIFTIGFTEGGRISPKCFFDLFKIPLHPRMEISDHLAMHGVGKVDIALTNNDRAMDIVALLHRITSLTKFRISIIIQISIKFRSDLSEFIASLGLDETFDVLFQGVCHIISHFVVSDSSSRARRGHRCLASILIYDNKWDIRYIWEG